MSLDSIQCQQDRAFNLENEKSLGGKKSKMRLTSMAVANALDEETEMLL